MYEVGPPNTPQEIKRFRRQSGDLLRRMGEPVVHMHKYTPEDEHRGVAIPCPACRSLRSGQTRQDCPVCYGFGWVSRATNPDMWIDARGNLTSQPTDIPAPLFGGFAEPVLTRIIEPDVATDEFRLSDQGVMTRVQEAQGIAFWTPEMYDGDMIVNVSVASDGITPNDIADRFILRQVMPQTIRGWGIRTNNRRELVGQKFEMDRVVSGNNALRVPVGGIEYGLL